MNFICCTLTLFVSLLTVFRTSAEVLELDESFMDKDSDGLWFVMFYAPWCGHCRHMEPTWMELGAEFSRRKSEITVGRIDVTKYSSVGTHYGVKGFPTIKLFKYGQQIQYHGLRNKPSLLSFLDRAMKPEVSTLSDQEAFSKTRNEHELFYLYIGSETDQLYTMYSKAAQAYFTTMHFYSALNSEILPPETSVSNSPTIMVFKGKKYFEMPADSLNAESVAVWIKAEQFPDYNQLTGASYHQLLEAGKKFAIAVVSKGDFFNITMDNIAQQRKFPFTFCWVKGNEIVNQITQRNISVPNVVVFDGISYEYYILQDEGSTVSVTKKSVEEFFQQIEEGSISPQGGTGVVQKFTHIMKEIARFSLNILHERPIIGGLLVVLPTVLLMGLCLCICTVSSPSDEGSDCYVEKVEEEENETASDNNEEESENPCEEDATLPSEENPKDEMGADGGGLRQRTKEQVTE